MDEISRDLMAGGGGLQAFNGAMEGNLGKWAEGAAEEEVAQAQQSNPPPPGMWGRTAGPVLTRFRAGLLAAGLITLAIVLLLAR